MHYSTRMTFFLFLLLTFGPLPQERPSSCSNCPVWNMPQKPFRVYGNTYYVGTHGLGSVLITSPSGHILIDGALPELVPQITGNIRSLGFRVEDIKLIVNSHVHFDHAGGIAELQKLSGARVAASPWAANVMKKGIVPPDDPQFGNIPIARVARVATIKDGETLQEGTLTITAHLTPGHTPGGTSWTWRSCENSRCLNLVYSDSLTAVSADNFFFTHSKVYPNAIADFERSFTFLDKTRCDILITPHPGFSNLWQRLESRTADPDALIDTTACHKLADSSRAGLKTRIATEADQ